MPTFTAGSGLGAWAAVARQKEYAGTFNTPTRTLFLKAWKPTHDPHIVQGGPYLAGGRIADIGSAHIKMYTDAKATMTGDVMTSGNALLLASAFGSNGTLKQSGTTGAYELFTGTKEGIVLEAPERHDASKESTFLDMQVGIPYTNAEITPYSYHSGVVTKAEFTFDRKDLVKYSYEIDFRQVETTTGEITPSFTTASVPFAMNETGSAFKIGKPGSATNLEGVRKMVVTLDHKMSLDRIYLGNLVKQLPISNGLVDVTVSMEADFTSGGKEIFGAFLANEPLEVIAECEGPEIGTSGKKNKFTFEMNQVFINSGGEPPIEGPDLIKNTMTAKATIDTNNDPVVKCKYVTSDTTF